MSLLTKLSNIVGEKNLRATPQEKAPFLHEPRGLWHGKALAVALPQRVEEVAALVRLAAAAGLHLVPQGGGTGLVGGQVPFDADKALVLNLTRLNKLRAVGQNTITAEAGCVLADIHQTAREQNRQFPLRLASEGSAQIGGLLATNAGGVHVLRYGMMRHLTLGLEAVLANGEVWHGLKHLPKDNSGYDLKDLLIGSEGTLAIITAAVLRLFPLDEEVATAMVALPSIEDALTLFERAQELAYGSISAFELIAKQGMEFILKHLDSARLPFEQADNFYVLLECAKPETLEALLEKENAVLKHSVIATSAAQAQALWALRENLSEIQKKEGASIKHDISVPLHHWAQFTQQACAEVERAVPATRPVIFGHLGDGNLHFNLSRPEHLTDEAFLAERAPLNKIIYDLVLRFDGSISAEHGIGILKQDELLQQKGTTALNAMRAIKIALDPNNILNPNKIIKLK